MLTSVFTPLFLKCLTYGAEYKDRSCVTCFTETSMLVTKSVTGFAKLVWVVLVVVLVVVLAGTPFPAWNFCQCLDSHVCILESSAWIIFFT